VRREVLLRLHLKRNACDRPVRPDLIGELQHVMLVGNPDTYLRNNHDVKLDVICGGSAVWLSHRVGFTPCQGQGSDEGPRRSGTRS
jgi:hypothetical protein